MVLTGGHAITMNLVGDISSGKFTNHLLRPSNLWFTYFMADIGYSLYSRFTSFFIYFTSLLIGIQFFTIPKFVDLLTFLIFILISFTISTFIEFILGFITFFNNNVWSIIEVVRTIKNFTSGSIFPLNILPILFSLVFTPFAFTFYHPMQIYLGKYTPLEMLYAFVGGITWCIILYLVAGCVFKIELKKNEAVGL